MLKIHWSFWLMAALFAVLGMGRLFVMLFAAVTLHEFAHIITATLFGAKFKGLNVSALGESAVIADVYAMPHFKRALVILAGPFCNFVLWLAFRERFPEFAFFNLTIGIFNLLPIFPLDGARLLQIMLEKPKGILRANRAIIKLGKWFCLAMFVPGLLQFRFFFPNFTLLTMALFLLWRSRTIEYELTWEYYRHFTPQPT